LSFEPPPTPVPLLVTETVASSKLHEDAAETIDALERRSEDTKLPRTLILAITEWSWRRASGRWMQRTPGQLTFRVRRFIGATAWLVRPRHLRPFTPIHLEQHRLTTRPCASVTRAKHQQNVHCPSFHVHRWPRREATPFI
jgi:hypothetical protein